MCRVLQALCMLRYAALLQVGVYSILPGTLGAIGIPTKAIREKCESAMHCWVCFPIAYWLFYPLSFNQARLGPDRFGKRNGKGSELGASFLS